MNEGVGGCTAYMSRRRQFLPTYMCTSYHTHAFVLFRFFSLARRRRLHYFFFFFFREKSTFRAL